jgi:predicted component of type VI protein secretion system
MVNVNNVLSAQDIEQAIAAIIKEYEPPLKLPLWTRDDAEAAIAQATELDTFLNEVRTGMNHETNPQVLRRQQELLNCIRSERKNRIQRNAHP